MDSEMDETDRERFISAEQRPVVEIAKCPRPTDQSGQRLGRTDRRDEVDVDLRLAQPGIAGSESHVAVERHLEAPAHGRAVDRGEVWLG